MAIDLFKRKCQQLADEAQQKIEKAGQAAKASERLKKDQQSYIEKAAEEKYKKFRNSYFGIIIIVGIYALTVTLFTALKSKRCISDCKAILETFIKWVMFYTDNLLKLSDNLSDVSTGIGQEIISVIVYWIIFILILSVGAALPLVALFFVGKEIVRVYQRCCADEISVIVALISFAIIIFFAEVMPANVLLLFMVSHAIYFLIRWYIHGYREARGL